MSQLPEFISDLAIILITASIVTLLFKKLKQPVVLGYIVAGFLASLHFKRFAEEIVIKVTGGKGIAYDFFEMLPEISDMANVTMWADIGVIFLLFALGLDFSFKKLIEVGGTAAIATFINVIAMICLGYVAGYYVLGWSKMDGLFLGGMLSMSSTTIIIKSFNDMSLQKKKFAGIVFAMLIVEDLVAVLLLVLLSAVAVSSNFEGGDLVFSIFKLGFFILIWFLVGIYVLPTLLKKLKPLLNDETLIVVAVALCLGMVYFATSIGFSSALGAFVTGSILAETIESKHIEKLLEPLKNIFGAVFFVSVGMMLDPHVVIDYAPVILLITALVIFGRSFFGTVGVLASGQGLKIAMQTGFSIALIGEFSFIIASLGMDLGVISPQLYPIIVTVSIITIFVSPYLLKSSEPAYNWVEKHIPSTWTKLLKGYGADSYNTINKDNEWKTLLKSILRTVVIYLTISLAILLISYQVVTPLIIKYTDSIWGTVLDAAITLTIMAPFLRSLMLKRNASDEFTTLWQSSDLSRGLLIFITILRIILGVILTSFILIPIFPQVSKLILIGISVVIVALIILSKKFKKQSKSIEERFLSNLYIKERARDKNAVLLPSTANDLRDKEIHVEEIIVSQTSPRVGKTLRELNFRQTTGVHIVSIIRGNKKINIPDADECLYPFDRLVIIGSDDEIQKLVQSLEDNNKAKTVTGEEDVTHHINIAQYPIADNSPLIGKSILDLNVQNVTECMVIGIDRDGESITNIDPTIMLKESDVLWIAGETEKLNDFEKNILK